ncbi:type IV secretion system protein [Photobacterium sp. ZSDE20]|nr:type IV secretion system protein [Photobacterium sp. ZSDE20]
MSADSVFRQTFSTVVHEFVDKVMNNPDMMSFSVSLLVTLCVVLIFTEIARFMLIGWEPESIIQCTLTVFLSASIYFSYNAIFDVLFETMDNVGLLILQIGTGTRDSMFLFKLINHALDGIYQEEVSLWDVSIGDAFMYAIWQLIGILLSIALFLVGSWAVWCLFLAKILGLIFVPMVAHPITRPFFDGWLKFTLGSLVLLVVVRAAGVLAGLAIQAQFTVSGLLQCSGGKVTSCLSKGGARDVPFSPTDSLELLVTMVLSVLIVLSSISLSSALTASVVSPSGTRAMSKGGMKLAKLLSKRFTGG